MHTITKLEESDEEFEVDDNTFQTQPTATLEDSLKSMVSHDTHM